MTSKGRDPLELSGRRLLDRYLVEAAIAQGGMAVIYRGRDLRLMRPVCIKVFHRLRPGDLAYQTGYQHFVQEAFALSQFCHPNTLRIYDFGHLDDGGEAPFQVSELLEGGTLAQLVRRVGPLEPDATLEILEPVIGALAEAHAAGIVHRDIKPSNILFGYAGNQRVVKLCDFGIAKVSDAGASPHRADDTIASTGERLRLYSPGWSAPEQIHGGEIGPACDVFALGLVTAYMLIGTPIFTATREEDVSRDRSDADAKVARTLAAAGVAEPIAAVLRRACADDPADRHATVEDFGAALRTAVRSAATPALRAVPREIVESERSGAPAASAPIVIAQVEAPQSIPVGPPLVVDPEQHGGDGEVLVAGRRLRLVPMSGEDHVDLGGSNTPRSAARFRVALTPSSGGQPRLHLKGLNCFVSRAGARPTTALDVDADVDIEMLAPDRRHLDGARLSLGRAADSHRLFEIGAVTLAVPSSSRAVLLDLGPGRELVLLHRGRAVPARAGGRR